MRDYYISASGGEWGLLSLLEYCNARLEAEDSQSLYLLKFPDANAPAWIIILGPPRPSL